MVTPMVGRFNWMPFTPHAKRPLLLANTSAGGTQNETIDVILHLSGPMLQPNISFDLNAPNAERLIQRPWQVPLLMTMTKQSKPSPC